MKHRIISKQVWAEMKALALKWQFTFKNRREFEREADYNYYDVCGQDSVLSEDFMREFKDAPFLCWGSISLHQKMSMEFIKEFKEKISWQNLVSNKYIKPILNEEFIQEFDDKLNRCFLVFDNGEREQRFSYDYVEERALGKRLWSVIRMKAYFIVEMSEDGKEVFME